MGTIAAIGVVAFMLSRARVGVALARWWEAGVVAAPAEPEVLAESCPSCSVPSLTVIRCGAPSA